MTDITVWIFDTKEEAKSHADANSNRNVNGPIHLGSVDVTDRSGNTSIDKYFEEYPGKWGIVIS